MWLVLVLRCFLSKDLMIKSINALEDIIRRCLRVALSHQMSLSVPYLCTYIQPSQQSTLLYYDYIICLN